MLIVTHGGTCRAINAYFNGIEEDGHITSANIKIVKLENMNINSNIGGLMKEFISEETV